MLDGHAGKIALGLQQHDILGSRDQRPFRRAQADAVLLAVGRFLAAVPEGGLQPRHRLGQPRGAHRFEQVVDGLNLESLHRIFAVRGDKDNRWRSRQFFEQVESVAVGHADVEEQGVRGERRNNLQSLCHAPGFAADLHARAPTDFGAQSLAGQRFVINDHHAEHGGSQSCSVAATLSFFASSVNRCRCG